MTTVASEPAGVSDVEIEKSRSISANRALAFLILMIVLGTALRVWNLTRLSFWADEGFAVSLAAQPMRVIIAGSASDVQPPLYFLLLHLWTLIGDHMFVVRYLSVFWGVLTIPLSYAIVNRWTNRTAGLVVTILVAVSPFHVWYSQEARMYTQVAFLSALSVYLAARLAAGDQRKAVLVGYVLTTAAAVYSQYFALFVLFFENLYLVVASFQQRDARLFRRWLVLQFLVALAFAPWAPVFIHQSLEHHMLWIPPFDPSVVPNTLIFLLTGATWTGDSATYLRAGLFGLLGLLVLGAGARYLWSHNTRGAMLLLGWFLVPLATVVVISRYRTPIYADKQFITILLPLLALVAMGISSVKRRSLQVLLILLVLAATYGPLADIYGTRAKQQWRELAAYIEAKAQPGDLIYLNPGAGALTLDYYLKRLVKEEAYPAKYDWEKGGYWGALATADVIDQRLSPLSADAKRIWLVQYSAWFWDPQAYIQAWLDQHYELRETPGFAGIQVRLYSARGQAAGQ